MDEESRREFLRELRDYHELRHYQEVSRQSREATNFQEHADDDVADDQPSAGEEQLAGATDDDSADETYYLYNDDFLRDADNDEPAAAHDDELDREYEAEDSDDDGFQRIYIGFQDFVRFIETWSQGSREEAYRLLSEVVEPDELEQLREVMDMETSSDFLEWLHCEAVDMETSGGFLEYQKDLGDGDHNECPICLEDYAPDDDLSVMPCTYGHRYHQDCLAAWLERSHLCPLCRHALPTDQEQGYGIQLDLN
jgi:hypothetical protein